MEFFILLPRAKIGNLQASAIFWLFRHLSNHAKYWLPHLECHEFYISFHNLGEIFRELCSRAREVFRVCTGGSNPGKNPQRVLFSSRKWHSLNTSDQPFKT